MDINLNFPDYPAEYAFFDPIEAVNRLDEIYRISTSFIADQFLRCLDEGRPDVAVRAFYPQIYYEVFTHRSCDSRSSFGHVSGPGRYTTTVTRPDLFRHYLTEQIRLLIESHGEPVVISVSEVPIPLHFALIAEGVVTPEGSVLDFNLRDVFDVPELAIINDNVVNGSSEFLADGSKALAHFSAPRIDYSLARLAHYTATDPKHFQKYVLFTNYQFYIDEFEAYAKSVLGDPQSGYSAFVGPGNQQINHADGQFVPLRQAPQMPSYHLKRENGDGITLVNIGVGPSNAKTATDHIAVLRPHTWLMVGHCAGLRNSQALGDFVLAHAYLREDHVLDDDLPLWVPIPALAEVQIALQEAVADVTQLEGYELKRIMRTGTVATIDNRNWELRDQSGPIRRLSQSRAVALDMESATIAANGFRFRVPYGTLLCVSDKPLHGELKLPGMAGEFYKKQVQRHLKIGIRAMELLRQRPIEQIHSRKLRSFEETAFL